MRRVHLDSAGGGVWLVGVGVAVAHEGPLCLGLSIRERGGMGFRSPNKATGGSPPTYSRVINASCGCFLIRRRFLRVFAVVLLFLVFLFLPFPRLPSA